MSDWPPQLPPRSRLSRSFWTRSLRMTQQKWKAGWTGSLCMITSLLGLKCSASGGWGSLKWRGDRGAGRERTCLPDLPLRRFPHRPGAAE